MSGPLEELRAAIDAYDSDPVFAEPSEIIASARRLLAALGTGERPVMCPICNRDDGTHQPGMPCTPLVNLWPQDARTIPQASTGATTGDES